MQIGTLRYIQGTHIDVYSFPWEEVYSLDYNLSSHFAGENNCVSGLYFYQQI